MPSHRRFRFLAAGGAAATAGCGAFTLCCLLLTGQINAARLEEPMGVHPTREMFTGAWRLISIETTTRNGTVADPFFQSGSTGLIVYDASGWMSVQIGGPHRVPWEVPVSRQPATLRQHLELKAAAYDSYYAYFGTWDYDATSSSMTHHVKSSVIPGEVGLDYSQQISVSGNRMTFTGHGLDHGLEITRTKVWERI